MSARPGDPARVVMTKWGERPHWEFDAVVLGSDEHGDWLGFRGGTPMARPGLSVVSPADQVGLVPAPGQEDRRGWLATFHAPRGPVHTYVDMTTPPYWDGHVVRATDLDLDVIREHDGRVWVDDEDEFAQHQVELGYPDDVIALAVSTAARIRSAVEQGLAPFDGTAEAWLERLARR